jgi:hypothetical protein
MKRGYLYICAALVLLCSGTSNGQDSASGEILISECRLNGITTPCTNFKLIARAGGHVVSVQTHERSKGQVVFELPNEFKGSDKIDLMVNTKTGWFEIAQLDRSWWRDTWELGLEHRPFSDDYGWVVTSKRTKCLGYLVYVNSEPGRVVSTEKNCH